MLVILGNPPYNGYAGSGGGRGARALPEPTARRRSWCGSRKKPGIERPVRPILPNGGATHSREDRTGCGQFHIELLVAGRAVVHRHEGALPEGVRRDSDRQFAWRPHHLGVCSRRDLPNQRDRLRAPWSVAWASRLERAIATLSKTPTSSSADKRVAVPRSSTRTRSEERRQALLGSLEATGIDVG